MTRKLLNKKPPDDVWTLTIPDYFPPSLNKVSMAHWSKVRKHKKRAIELLHVYSIQAGGIPKFNGKVAVTITRMWGYRQRAWDIENLYGAVKPLIDAMRRVKNAGGRTDRGRGQQGGLGIIENDDPGLLSLSVLQRKKDITIVGESADCHIEVIGERVK